MRLTPPTQMMFWISVILVVLAVLGGFVTIPFISANAFWVAVVGYVVLFLGNTMTGM